MVNTKNRLFWLIPIAAVLIAVIAGFALLGGGAESKWQAQYDLGVRYLNEMNYEQAILAFTAAIEIDPNRAEAYLARADAYEAVGDDLAAALDREKAAKLAQAAGNTNAPQAVDTQALFALLSDCLDRGVLPPADLPDMLEAAAQADPSRNAAIPMEDGSRFYAFHSEDGGIFWLVDYRADGSLQAIQDYAGGETAQRAMHVDESGCYEVRLYQDNTPLQSAEYNPDGSLESRHFFYPDGHTRLYEGYENGALAQTREYYENRQPAECCDYNAAGHLIKRSRSYENGEPQELAHYDDEGRPEWVERYNEQGARIDSTTYYYDDQGNLSGTDVFVYNGGDWRTELQVYNADGQLERVTRYNGPDDRGTTEYF